MAQNNVGEHVVSEPSIFTRIMTGEIPAKRVYEDEECICIHDISPQAPVHVLLIPRKPIPRLVDASTEDQALLGRLLLKVGDIAKTLGVADGFRVVINNGETAGQTVFHLHLHILGEKNYVETDGLQM